MSPLRGTRWCAAVVVLALATAARGEDSPGTEQPKVPSFTPQVNFVLSPKEGGLQGPSGAAIDSKHGEILVADVSANAVIAFSAYGREKGRFQVSVPTSVVFDSKGRLYITTLDGGAFSCDFRGERREPLRMDGLPEGLKPPSVRQVCIDEKDNLLVLDGNNHAVLMFNEKGSFVRAFGAIGEKKEGMALGNPNALYATRKRVLVIDDTTAKVSVFGKASGEFLFSFAGRGETSGLLAVPVSIVTDGNDNIFVLDALRGSISIYDSDGKFLAQCGGVGKEPGWFYFPKSMTIDPKENTFYICEPMLRRIQGFKIPLDRLPHAESARK